jgi:hypothetical protein
MIIENKRTKETAIVTIDQWAKMGEIQLQKFWNVIDKGEVDITDNLTIEKFLDPQKKNADVVVDDKKAKQNKIK